MNETITNFDNYFLCGCCIGACIMALHQERSDISHNGEWRS